MATLELEEINAKPGSEVNAEGNEKFKLWKSLGDELLFYKKLSCGMEAFHGVLAAKLAIQSGAKKLQIFREDREKAGDTVQHYPTQLKGTAWVAGFPIKNLIVKRKATEQNDKNEPMEFIGPSIDLGFRLAKFSSPSRMVLSLPLTWILAKILQNDGSIGNLKGRSLQFSYLGRESLKGVDKVGIGYPIFWVNLSDSVQGLSTEERTVLSKHVAVKDIVNFCESLFNDPEINISCPFIMDDKEYSLSIPDPPNPEGENYRKAYNDFLTAFPSVTANVQTTPRTGKSATNVISEIKTAVGKVRNRAAEKKTAAKKTTIRKPAAKKPATRKSVVKKPAVKPSTTKFAVKKPG